MIFFFFYASQFDLSQWTTLVGLKMFNSEFYLGNYATFCHSSNKIETVLNA